MEIKILNERPEDMSFEDYKSFRRIQDKLIKRHKKGKVVFLSKLFPTKTVLEQLRETKTQDSVGQLIFKGTSYRKPTE